MNKYYSSAMSSEVSQALKKIYEQCQRCFTITHAAVDSAAYAPADVADIPHSEWIPAALQEYGHTTNGYILNWETKAAGQDHPDAGGEIALLTLKDIYRERQDELFLDDEPAHSRLHRFRVVDAASGYLVVGLYHDAAQDPGLYVFDPGDNASPYPLHVDLPGYIALLEHSLGYTYWQYAALALLPDDGRNPAHLSNLELTSELRRALSAWVPEFDYDAFVACYHRVKLRDYTPSGMAPDIS